MTKIELNVYNLDGKLIHNRQYDDIESAVNDADVTNAGGKYVADVILNGAPLSDIEHVRKEQLRRAGLQYVHETEDNSLGATLYQGKTLSQWEKEFNGEFNVHQLFQLLRSGVDLGRIKLGLVDESDDLDEQDDVNDKVLFKGEEFMFENDDEITEGRNWRTGGYGGSGRSYSSFNGSAPRGAAIGWYAVADLDPKAKGKMPGWRCGPSNFPFTDLLYPERKYKVGTMVMRNKYIKAGEMSGEKYIAIPSYFDAIKNNDEEALNLLKLLNIPLDLTFGMDPNDDYSVTYR